VTLGVATFPHDAKTRDELIGKADRAMYEGKMSGRNKVVLA
jgi:PleD family two-component response regulator